MSIGRQRKDATFDLELLMKDAGAVGSSAAATVGGDAKVLDLGLARVDGRVVVDVSAMTVADATQLYGVELQVSNTAAGAFTEVVPVAALRLGHATATGAASGPNNAPGRFELGFSNEVNGVVYRFARLFTRVAGDGTPSINYKAYAVKATT
jgi:hypothetical protein